MLTSEHGMAFALLIHRSYDYLHKIGPVRESQGLIESWILQDSSMLVICT